MAMYDHIHHLDNVGKQLEKKLGEIRALDVESVRKFVELRAVMESQLEQRAREEDGYEGSGDSPLWDELTSLSEAKQRAAIGAYELIDKHIVRLDRDLEELTTLIEADRQALGMPPMPEVAPRPMPPLPPIDLPVPSPPPAMPAPTPVPPPEPQADVPVPSAPAEAQAFDPNEPLFCICQRPSFGPMVGCDGKDCKYEWFHFECVGLVEEPVGDWYCPDCQALMAKNSKKRKT